MAEKIYTHGLTEEIIKNEGLEKKACVIYFGDLRFNKDGQLTLDFILDDTKQKLIYSSLNYGDITNLFNRKNCSMKKLEGKYVEAYILDKQIDFAARGPFKGMCIDLELNNNGNNNGSYLNGFMG